MTNTELNNDIKPTPNKQKIRLIFPYEENSKFKKLGVKWDNENKMWYFPSLNGELPDNLKPLKCYKIAINYDDKEFFKPLLKSMRWDKNNKIWLVNQEDYDKFLSI
jgi:hypothetical protein